MAKTERPESAAASPEGLESAGETAEETASETGKETDKETGSTAKTQEGAGNAAPQDGGDFRWYAIQVHAGCEKRVKDVLESKAREEGLERYFEQVLVPTEEVVQMRRGARRSAERKFFPGYILVRMKVTERTRHFVMNVERVKGFVGGRRGEALPLRDDEMIRIRSQVQEGIERPRPSVTFEVGEQVRVCEGPFTSFNGVVEEVDEERTRLKVCISIFGRSTPVELDYGQVEKS